MHAFNQLFLSILAHRNSHVKIGKREQNCQMQVSSFKLGGGHMLIDDLTSTLFEK